MLQKIKVDTATSSPGSQLPIVKWCINYSKMYLHPLNSFDRKDLEEGEELVVEQSAVLAFERTVELDIRKTGGFLVAWS